MSRLVRRVRTLLRAPRLRKHGACGCHNRRAVRPRRVLPSDRAARGSAVLPIWDALDRKPDDVVAIKSGASAFFPGKCNLKPQLDARGVDTILDRVLCDDICCESSARDAVEPDYKVIMISDALSGQAHGLHEATLATFYRTFGDVRPSEDVIRLLHGRAAPPEISAGSARARQWIEQDSLRLFHPETFASSGPATRHQSVHLDAHDVGGPSGPPLVRATRGVRPGPGASPKTRDSRTRTRRRGRRRCDCRCGRALAESTSPRNRCADTVRGTRTPACDTRRRRRTRGPEAPTVLRDRASRRVCVVCTFGGSIRA